MEEERKGEGQEQRNVEPTTPPAAEFDVLVPM